MLMEINLYTTFVFLSFCFPKSTQMKAKEITCIRQRDLQVRTVLVAMAWEETLQSGEAVQNSRNCTGFEARRTIVESQGWYLLAL